MHQNLSAKLVFQFDGGEDTSELMKQYCDDYVQPQYNGNNEVNQYFNDGVVKKIHQEDYD